MHSMWGAHVSTRALKVQGTRMCKRNMAMKRERAQLQSGFEALEVAHHLLHRVSHVHCPPRVALPLAARAPDATPGWVRSLPCAVTFRAVLDELVEFAVHVCVGPEACRRLHVHESLKTLPAGTTETLAHDRVSMDRIYVSHMYKSPRTYNSHVTTRLSMACLRNKNSRHAFMQADKDGGRRI